jgi:DNA-binding Lrp family transcriptional regulator
MKITKGSLIAVLTLMVSLGAYSPALALEADVSAEASVNVTRTSDTSDGETETKANEDSEVRTTELRTTSEVRTTDRPEQTRVSSEVRSTTTRESSTTTIRARLARSDEHRSQVSSFVRNLLNIADRSAGIGAEVRVIAREQENSSTSTVEAIAKVEERGGFKRFLIGSDYRNLGAIRSEVARTGERLERLSALASSTTNVQVRADLTAQIELLEEDRTRVSTFVEDHEDRFSVFGWFVKIFNK